MGDVASDTFITLTPESAAVCLDDDGPTLVLPFGTKIPYGSVTTVAVGGNAANAAVACARMGLHSSLAGFVGDDPAGREARDTLIAEGVDTSLLLVDPTTPTNRDFILLLNHERTILVQHGHHDCQWNPLEPDQTPRWLYLSSLGRGSDAYWEQILTWLAATPEVELAFAPGSYQVSQGCERLAAIYARAGLAMCNHEEAETITGMVTDDMDELLAAMLDLGPTRVVITDAEAGAYGATGDERYWVPIYPDYVPAVDRTGAGDAFAGTLVACVAQGMSLEHAMHCAPVNSMSVVHHVGTQAGLLDNDAIDAHLAIAPPEFVVRSRRVESRVSARR